jgi:hypothetical protein
MAEGDLNWPRANLTQAKTYSVSSSLLRDIAHVRLVSYPVRQLWRKCRG